MPAKITELKGPSERVGEKLMDELARSLHDDLRTFALEESNVGIVARAALRAFRTDDKTAARKCWEPLIAVMDRTRQHGESGTSLLPDKLGEIDRLARELTGRRRRGRPTLAETNQRNKQKEQHDFLVGCDLEERALAISFIRLIRTNYWLSHFVKIILRLDARSPNQIPIKEVQSQLTNQAEIEDLVGRVQYIGKSGWWRDHPAISAVVEEWGDDVYQYRGDHAINKLIESAKGALGK